MQEKWVEWAGSHLADRFVEVRFERFHVRVVVNVRVHDAFRLADEVRVARVGALRGHHGHRAHAFELSHSCGQRGDHERGAGRYELQFSVRTRCHTPGGHNTLEELDEELAREEEERRGIGSVP
jgi:hypothetical protein